MSLPSQGARSTLSPPSSKSSREFKHKPICERIFCSSVIHFSLGIPSQTSGVLLAFELAYVFISLTKSPEHRSRGVVVFLLSFLLLGEVAFRVSFQCLTYSNGAGGRGKWGTIAIFEDALENNREHICTVTSTVTCCWSSDTFKRKRLALYS